jgi:hypothetical protein
MKSLTMPQAVFFGAVLVAASLYLASVSGYRHQMVPRPYSTVMKLDKFTGEMWDCGASTTARPGCHRISN